MIPTAAILLGLAAIGGATMFGMLFKGKERPNWLRAGHFALGGAGLVILVVALVYRSLAGEGEQVFGLGMVAAVLLVVAASLGVSMLVLVGKKRRIPPALPIAHGLTALAGVILTFLDIGSSGGSV